MEDKIFMKGKFMAILVMVCAISAQATAVNYYYGAMGSGKTAKMLMTVKDYENNGLNINVLSYCPDKTVSKTIAKSRTGLEREVNSFNNDTDFFDVLLKNGNAKFIFIDEAQFLLYQQVKDISYIVDHSNVTVQCFGLKTDFTGGLFQGSGALFSLADHLEELHCLCHCGKPATMNARINPLTGEICRTGAIEDLNKSHYVPLCRKHFVSGEWRK